MTEKEEEKDLTALQLQFLDIHLIRDYSKEKDMIGKENSF